MHFMLNFNVCLILNPNNSYGPIPIHTIPSIRDIIKQWMCTTKISLVKTQKGADISAPNSDISTPLKNLCGWKDQITLLAFIFSSHLFCLSNTVQCSSPAMPESNTFFSLSLSRNNSLPSYKSESLQNPRFI